MTLPATISTTALIGNAGARGAGKRLWKASDGDLYWFGVLDPGAPAYEVGAFRSTDGGNTWDSPVETDREGEGPPNNDIIESVSCDRDGDTMYVAWTTQRYSIGMDVGYDIEFQVFDMDANTWTGSYETVDIPIIESSAALCCKYVGVARRTSDVVIVAQIDDARNMGNDYRRVGYYRGNAGSWTGPVGVDAGGEQSWISQGAFVGSVAGDAHLCWFGSSDSVNVRTLRADNTLATTASQSIGQPIVGGTAGWATGFDGGGEQFIGFVYEEQGSSVVYIRFIEDGSDDAITDGFGAVEATAVNTPRSLQWVATDDDLYAFYSPTDDDDMDYEVRADATTGSWTGTITTFQVGTFVNFSGFMTANFVHSSGNGGAEVVGVVWRDDADSEVKYDEITIVAGSTPSLVYRPNPYGAKLGR